MIVCAHGNVASYCKKHDMVIVETYEGELLEYRGVSRVLVTAQEIPEVEYYFIKGELLKRGVELVSTTHKDSVGLSEFIEYVANRDRRKKTGGRYKFGFQNIDGEVVLTDVGRAVVKRIIELRDAGFTYQRIRDDEGVHHLDGRKLNISTIQIIIKNRSIYEKEGL